MRTKATPHHYTTHELKNFARYLQSMMANQENPFWDPVESAWHFRFWTPRNLIADQCPLCENSVARRQLLQLARFLDLITRSHPTPHHDGSLHVVNVYLWFVCNTVGLRAKTAILQFIGSNHINGNATNAERVICLKKMRKLRLSRSYFHIHKYLPSDLLKIPAEFLERNMKKYLFFKKNKQRFVRMKAARNEGMCQIARILLAKMDNTEPPSIKRQPAGDLSSLIIRPPNKVWYVDWRYDTPCCAAPSNYWRSMSTFWCKNCGCYKEYRMLHQSSV